MVDSVSRAGTLFIVATPIGNLEDITVRALRVLREVLLIAAEDTRRTAQLLARYAIQTSMTSLHEHNEEKKTPSLLKHLERGDSVALVSDAGTPTVSDPGARLVRAAIDANVRVEAIPGPSAAIAALVVSGLPITTFSFLGFPPTRAKDRKTWFARAGSIGGTIVFFESPHRIQTTLKQLKSVVGDCQVAVARELTKVHEELVRGPISVVADRVASARGEFTVVVEIGRTPNIVVPCLSTCDADMLTEFGLITNKMGLRRREVIKILARKYARPTNDIYEAIERAKKLAK